MKELAQTILTFFLIIWVISIIVSLVGCTVVQEKADRYREASERLVNADNVKVCYVRQNDQIVGVMEYRCTGEGCELPECPK